MKKKIRESELKNENRNSVPILASGIGTRISDVAVKIGSRKKAAKVANISPATLQRYISEEVKPSFEPMAGLARAAGVSLEWLATGQGDMVKPAAPAAVQPGRPGAINMEVLQAAIEVLEEVLSERRLTLPPDKKAEAISLLYELEVSGELGHDAADAKNKVVRLVRLAS